MIEEIAAGIKNALDHGSTLEEASQSFITAGYNKNEVQEAVKLISKGNVDIYPEAQIQSNQSETSKKEKKEVSGKVVVMLIILLILATTLGILGYFIYIKPID